MAAESNIDVTVRGVDELSPELRKLESGIIRFVGAVSASLAALKIGAAPLKAAADFERELANVSKTTEFTGDRLKFLSDELVRLSQRTNVATVDLAKIAAAAGQQGLGEHGVEAVVKFTDSVARMASVLDITAEEAGDNVGKILNIFRIPIQDVEKVVSGLNETTNQTTANGKGLLDVVRRIGDATGALTIQQAMALGAAGIDFGVSEEVVGTAFSELFANMQSKGEQFAKLMGMTTTAWITQVRTDGLAAFKLFQDRMRELEPVSQQSILQKLGFGGRQGALINKFIQDSSNAVLSRAEKAANTGFEGGISATREQATVLNTLTEQFNVLRNNIFAIGKEIGDQALLPMTSGIARLSAALQSDSFQSFARAVGDGFRRATETVISMMEAVASLNVNWENFLKPLELFLKLKFVEYMARGALALLAWSNPLKSIANGAAQAAAETDKLNAAQARGATANSAGFAAAAKTWFTNRVLGIQSEIQAWKSLMATRESERAQEARIAAERKKNLAEQAAAQAVIAAQQRALNQASPDVPAVQRGKLDIEAKQASAQARAASDAYRQSLAAAQAAEAALNQRRQTSVQQKEAQHIARMTEIQTAYERRKAEIRATGTRAGLSALERETAALRAEEERRHLQSIAKAEAYWARQIAIARTGAAATVAAQKQALQAANVALDTKLADRAAAQNAVIAATQKSNAASERLQELKQQEAALGQNVTKMGLWTQTVALAGAAWGIFVKGISAGARILLGGFTWIAIIYSLLDAFGLIDKVIPVLGRIGESLGLVTKTKHDAAAAAEAHARALETETARVKEQTAAYEKLKDESGKIAPASIESISQGLATGSPEEALTAFNKLGVAAVGAQRQMDNLQQQADRAAVRALEAPTAQMTALEKKIADLTKKIEGIAPNFRNGSSYFQRLNAELQAAQTEYNNLKQKAADASATMVSSSASAATQLENLQRVGALAARAFTDNSLKAAQDILIPMAAQKELAENLRTQVEDYNRQLAENKAPEAKKAIQELLDTTKAKAEEAGRKVTELRQKLVELALLPENMGTEVARNMMAVLQELAGKQPEVIRGIVGAAQAAKDAGTALTGTIANIRSPKGTQTFDPKDRESEARRLARARVEFARQQSRNEINEAKANAQLQEEIDTAKYDRGLMTLQDYWDGRARIANTMFQKELNAKKQEAAQIDKELVDAEDRGNRAEITNLQKDQIRVRSELAVLGTTYQTEEQKIRDQRLRAQQQFDDQMIADHANFMKAALTVATPDQVFAASLAAQQTQAAVFLEKLRTQAEQGGTEAARATARRALEELQVQQIFVAVGDAISGINDRISLAFGSFDLFANKLEFLRSLGLATTAEVEQASRAEMQRLVTFVEGQIVLLEQRLARARLQGVNENSTAYLVQAQQLDDLRFKLAQLQLTADQTALSINRAIGDSLADGFGKLEPTLKSLKDTLLGIIRDIASAVQQTIGRAFAEEIMVRINGGKPDGGLGGLISGALQKNLGRGGDMNGRGSTMFNPLYVQDVPKGLAQGVPGASADPLGDFINKLPNLRDGAATAPVVDPMAKATEEGAASLSTSMASAAETFLGTIQGGMGNVGNLLTSAFNGVIGGAGKVGELLTGVAKPVITPGSSPLSPMYTKSVDLPASQGAGAVLSPLASVQLQRTRVPEVSVDPTAVTNEAVEAGAEGLTGSMLAAGQSFISLMQGGVSSIGAVLTSIVTSLLASAAASKGASMAASFASSAAVAHTGGFVGDALTKRFVNPLVFRNAQRYHNGGIAGLKPNEVPAILEEGERVISKRSEVAAGAGGGVSSIRNVLVTDKNFVPDALQSPEGEKVIMTFIRSNKATIKQMLGR